MTFRHTKIAFPLWQFLNQPLFDSKTKTVFNPYHFCYLYRVQLLERCLTKECGSQDRRRH